MKAAWMIHKANPQSKFRVFANALRQAWASAKSTVEYNKQAAATQAKHDAKIAQEKAAVAAALANDAQLQSKIDKINEAVFIFSMKDRWSQSDWAYSRKLEAERQAILNSIAVA